MLGRPTLSAGGQKAQTGFPGPNPAWRCGHTSLKALGELLSFSEAESHSSHSLASSSVFKAEHLARRSHACPGPSPSAAH